jgi:hypothetical protein
MKGGTHTNRFFFVLLRSSQNKADREDLREVSYAEADLLAQTYDALFFEASARTRVRGHDCRFSSR